MIGRIWHGWARGENADAFQRVLEEELLPAIRSSTEGFLGVYVLRRDDGEEVEFETVTLWESFDAIATLVGEDYEAAYVREETRALLDRFDERVVHYQVVLSELGDRSP